jgi:hypothetical protein
MLFSRSLPRKVASALGVVTVAAGIFAATGSATPAASGPAREAGGSCHGGCYHSGPGPSGLLDGPPAVDRNQLREQ